MLGITIGIGQDWKELAYESAARMSQMTGLECMVITEKFRAVTHPSWLKLHILEYCKSRKEHNSFLAFDADLVSLIPWDPVRLFNDTKRAFCAVPDRRAQAVLDECKSLNFPFPDLYVNAGFMIFGLEHAAIFKNAWNHHPQCGEFLEQGALNVELLESGCEVCRLPRQFNYLIGSGHSTTRDYLTQNNIINAHACATGPQKARELAKLYLQP